MESKGKTILMMAIDGVAEIMFILDNKANLRPEARSVIRYLRNELKLNCLILSGDS